MGLYTKGHRFSTPNTARSALSSILRISDCDNCGSHPLVVRFMKGVFEKRKPQLKYDDIWESSKVNNNNLLLGSSITKSGLHRGPNTRYILYNDTIKIYKLELKPKYLNNYNIYTTRIKKKYLIIKSRKKTLLKNWQTC